MLSANLFILLFFFRGAKSRTASQQFQFISNVSK